MTARAATPPPAPPEGDGFRTPGCELFLQSFRGLQEVTGCVIPPRKSFSPAAARAFLPYVSILEIKEPRTALVRLVGTAIVNRTRYDNTGRNLLDIIPPDHHDWSWRHFRRILDTPCGCTFLATEDYRNLSVLIEIISFPFADNDGVPRFIVSLSVEIDRQELLLRGDDRMRIAAMTGYRYLDIGAGTGSGAGAGAAA